MLHTIISEYDIFYTDKLPEFTQRRSGYGIMTMRSENGSVKPYSFFSTDPSDYLKKENQI